MSRSTDPASLDEVFDALSDPYCRRILLAVSRHGPRDREEFTTDAFASGEMGGDDPDVLRTLLFREYVPKLADRGYVEWDPEAETIRRGPNFRDLAPLVEVLVEHEEGVPADLP